MARNFSFGHRLGEGLEQLDLQLDAAALARLELYFDELRKWSWKINLIAKDTADQQIVDNHFLDSLTLLPLLATENIHLLDVGTGAGFPGLALKAARPDIELTLVEPRQKRVFFLGHIVRSLQLKDVRILPCRVEDRLQLPESLRFSHLTSRAVTDIGGFLTMVARFFHPDLTIICMKGPKWHEELAAAAPVIARLPLLKPQIHVRTLPFSGAERALVVFQPGGGT